MPRSKGLRDDDILGRLAEIETRLDAFDADQDAPVNRTTDALRVPERDERRDTEVRNRQVYVQAEPVHPGYPPGMPDSMGGEMVPDRVRVFSQAERDAAEARARARAKDAEDDGDDPKAGDDMQDRDAAKAAVDADATARDERAQAAARVPGSGSSGVARGASAAMPPKK